MRSLAAVHLVLAARGGKFFSLTDPPDALRQAAAACRNVGAWPVLVGSPGEHDAMLASPVILYDYPQVAAESPGDLFDGTEIDELLTLRIMTLTEDEKAAARATDERTRGLLQRTESLTREQLAGLHGVLRRMDAGVLVDDVELHPGDRVRLKPGLGGDIFDLCLPARPPRSSPSNKTTRTNSTSR